MMKTKNETGQSIVLIVVMIFGLFALSALVIDGGNAYLSRRQAQTAADSAALAAAYEFCVNYAGPKPSTVDDTTAMDAVKGALQPIADEYAVTQNHADSATVDYLPPDSDYPKGKITVNAFIERPTFFARVISIDTIDVSAKASVGCFLPGDANKILPVAWTCRAHEGTVDTCVLHQIPVTIWDNIVAAQGPNFEEYFENNLLNEGNEITEASYQDIVGDPIVYVVMDDDDFQAELDCVELNPLGEDPTAEPPNPPGVGLINCDFNNDDIMDVEGGAERGWLQLTPGGGAVDLWTVMLNGYDGVLELPQWFVANTGTINSVFINAHQIKFRKNLIPVYNGICEDTTYETLKADCWEDYIAGDIIRPSTGNQTYHRVPGVAVFVISCVSKGVPEPCPGKTLSGVKNNTSTIEGYFLSGYVAGTKISNSGFDLGVYVLSLIE